MTRKILSAIDTQLHRSIVDHHGMMVQEALPRMGFDEQTLATIPQPGIIQAAAGHPGVNDVLAHYTQGGRAPRLLLVRRVGGLHGQGIGLTDLIRRYGQATGKAPRDSGVLRSEWGDVGNRGWVHDSGRLQNRWDILFLLGDTRDPLDEAKSINGVGVPGLAYTNMTSPDQAQALAEEAAQVKERAAGADIELVSASVGALIMEQLAVEAEGPRREGGQARLVHYKDKGLHTIRDRQVPSVTLSNSPVQGLRFHSLHVNRTGRDVGLHRALRVNLGDHLAA